ncbi:MAG TPA: DUF559 domain-containing protein [Polyangiaceae bacterium]|jgi:very-short-patch-repair endonuclease
MSELGAIADSLRDCDYGFVWLDGDGLSAQVLAEMLYAGSKPIFVIEQGPEPRTGPTFLAIRARNHVVVDIEATEEEALAIAELCANHACGAKISIFSANIQRCFAVAESPPEQRLALHLCSQLDFLATVTPQFPITIDGKNYRADFMVKSGSLELIVEVDGHAFHERTKEQAARDKSRDRAMLAAGYKVMRFTGSEVWNTPVKCVEEVERMVRVAE